MNGCAKLSGAAEKLRASSLTSDKAKRRPESLFSKSTLRSRPSLQSKCHATWSLARISALLAAPSDFGLWTLDLGLSITSTQSWFIPAGGGQCHKPAEARWSEGSAGFVAPSGPEYAAA